MSNRKKSAEYMNVVVSTLKQQSMTTAQISTATGIGREIVGRKIKLLREIGAIHVTEYRREEHKGGYLGAVCTWGEGKDVPDPNIYPPSKKVAPALVYAGVEPIPTPLLPVWHRHVFAQQHKEAA